MASSGESIFLLVAGGLFIAAVVGALFLGFYVAGKKRERPNYVLRGLFWSVLFFFGGLMLLAAFAFGACILIVTGMKF